MYLKRLKLRDWRAYISLDLIFPEPLPDKNVVLIGAQNGYGKTSLLEALLVGIFGRDAYPFLARAENAGSWGAFLEKAFNVKALEDGRSSMTIEVTLEDDYEGPTMVRRVWHFSSGRKYQPQDDEVRIYQGEDQELVQIPRTEDDPEDVWRSIIVKNFLPAQLAQFFLFDGEKVQQLARQKARDQVRMGLDGLMGVNTLRVLKDDLKAFATQQQNQTRSFNGNQITELRNNRTRLEDDLKATKQALASQQSLLENARIEQERCIRELAALGLGTQANVGELHQTREGLRREQLKTTSALAELIQGELAITLAGPKLLKGLETRLRQEDKRSKWEAGRTSTHPKLELLLKSLRREEPPFDPPLITSQRLTLEERVTRAWDALWLPPPDDMQGPTFHEYLSDQDRMVVLDRLGRLGSTSLSALKDLLHRLDQLLEEIRRCSQQLASLEGSSDRVDQLQTQLKQAVEQVVALERKVGELERSITAMESQLNDVRANIGRQEGAQKDAEPQLRRAQLSRDMMELIDDLIQQSSPMFTGHLSEAMTRIYRILAHKSRVTRIEVTPECDVHLYGSHGRELRSAVDSSAGEDQIFALALISAIAEVSDSSFPVVMDTPLARLDTRHRLNVLNHFTARDADQIILLSTPEEVHGQFLDAIRHRVSAAWLIEHEELGNGVGQSRIKPGYFERI